jgi:hypothetical protein
VSSAATLPHWFAWQYHPRMPEQFIALVALDPVGHQILDQLEQSPTFGPAGNTEVGGQDARRVSVGNAESEQAAHDTLTEELGHIAPDWADHLRVIWPAA